MKDTVKNIIFEKFLQRMNVVKGIGMHILCALLSYCAARGCIANAILPFGISFCAGVPTVYTAASAAGAVIGYILPSNNANGFSYIAIVFAVCAIKLLTKDLLKLSRNGYFFCITAFAATACIQLVSSEISITRLILVLIESIFAALGTLAIYTSSKTLAKVVSGLPLKTVSCLILSFNMLFMWLFNINLGSLNIGRLLICAVILCCASFSGLGGGAVCSIAAGAAYVMTYPNDILPFAVFCVAGLFCGMLSKTGRLMQSIAFVLTGSCVCLCLGVTDAAVAMISEIAFSAAIFLAVPERATISLGKLLSPPAETVSFDGVRHALALRLDFASKTLTDVCETVDEVALTLAKHNTPDFNNVIVLTEKEACKGCLMRTRCWETLRSETVEAVIELARFTREGEKPQLSKKTMEFGSRCSRMDTVMNSLNRHYSDYLLRVAAHSQTQQVRKVISSQFCGISRMLYDLSHEFSDQTRFDLKLAREISAAIFDMGLTPCDCCCRIDPFERMNIEISAKADRNTIINRAKLNRLLNGICSRQFAVPLVIRAKEHILITATENTVFTVDTGVSQYCCPDSTVCGDSYELFFDGRGRMFMVLSDGMGHGMHAALDSSMASGMMSRLLKAGFGYDCSLDIVNSSMIYKSSDESLATMDVAAIDLFTGKADILKAGAAPTLMRRSGRTGKAQSTSLPAGILHEVGFDKATVTLKANDIILLVSDGVTHSGTDWICAELENWQDGTAQQLSEKIALAAKKLRADGHSDDITVITSIIKKAV